MLKYHIQTIEVGAAGATDITFSSIPQDYDDLLILVSARSTRDLISDDSYVVLNSSTSGYSNRRLYGYNGSVGSDNSGATNKGITGALSASQNTANTFGNVTIHIPNYTMTTNKSISSDGVGENNGGSFISITGSVWSGTSAITEVKFAAWAGNLTQYSSASLYGIKRGSDGVTGVIPAAEGGTVTASGGYTIHTFNTSGTFVANRDLDVEYLVIGGGGGGGGRHAGGGGAGGYRTVTSQALSRSTSYPVLVGGGGAGFPDGAGQGDSQGTQGVSSVFATTTSAGGGGGGGAVSEIGGDGGSGGGGTYQGPAGTGNVPATSPPQGNNGGLGAQNYVGGGGGGAGAVGGAGLTGTKGGDGGVGSSSSITGTSVIRAAGGGGGGWTGNAPGVGGTGGGGNGVGYAGSADAGSGTANTGSGGGGSGGPESAGGNGGSGVVIIRYLTPA